MNETWLAVNPNNDFRLFYSKPEWNDRFGCWFTHDFAMEGGMKINPSNLAIHVQDRGEKDNPIRLDIFY